MTIDMLIDNNRVKHQQLSIEKREELALYAVEYGINYAAKVFSVHYVTAKRWHDRYLSNDSLKNLELSPLTIKEHKFLKSLTHLVGKISLNELKREYSLSYSIDTLAKFYRKRNIQIENKQLLILKCTKCKYWVRVINVFFGRQRHIRCPHCSYYKLSRIEYINLPFYNTRSRDYYFDQYHLTPVGSNFFIETVLPLINIPKDLKILFVYASKPRKHNRIHIIKYFEKLEGNTIPITYCNVRYPHINRRKILNPRSDTIDVGLICQNCQMPYLRDFNEYVDQYPAIKVGSANPSQKAIKLFLLAQKYNNKTACALTGISKREFYRIKKRHADQFVAIKSFFKGVSL